MAARLADLLAGEPGFEGVTDIPAQYQGTYKGAGLLAPYLKAAGVTTIELLPVHETNASETGRAGATNAWGYMTLSFFAPNRRYAVDKSRGGPTREFKEMVRAFHDAGMEVYLDVIQRQSSVSPLPPQSVFCVISKHFTATLHIPRTSPH